MLSCSKPILAHKSISSKKFLYNFIFLLNSIIKRIDTSSNSERTNKKAICNTDMRDKQRHTNPFNYAIKTKKQERTAACVTAS